MLAFSSLLGNVEGQNIYRIWYDKPASYWEEALPVGNGRIAAMVFGDPQLEQIQLNEETVSGALLTRTIMKKQKRLCRKCAG